MSPTIVLVHGAFADGASWDRVIDPLLRAGHRVVSAANPLRSLARDAESVSDLVRAIDGPVVLVAHSYGGAVISNVDPDAGEITGLRGESVDVHEPGDLAGVGVDVRDHGAPVGVGDEHDRPLDAADDVADGGGVGGEAA